MSNQRTISPFELPDPVFEQILDCVSEVMAPYFVRIVTDDPSPMPHRELMIGGTPQQVGQPSGILGVAPWACGTPLQNTIAFTFSQAHFGDIEAICETTAHELGHLFDMDHEIHADDAMSYAFPVDELQHFTNVDSQCFGLNISAPTPCYCNSASTQNTHQKMRIVVGGDRLFHGRFGDPDFMLPPGVMGSGWDRFGSSCGTRTDRASAIQALPTPL